MLKVTTPAGASGTITLAFTAKTFNLKNDASLPGQLDEIATYLDGVFQAAEAPLGLKARLFAKPKVRMLPKAGKVFGQVLTTVSGASLTGGKLVVSSAKATVVGDDPIGLSAALVGSLDPATGDLTTYLQRMVDIAEFDAAPDDGVRRLGSVAAVLDPGGTLTTTVTADDAVAGPAATVALVASSGLADLFTSSASTPNSATTADDSESIRDADALFTDVFTGAIAQLGALGIEPNARLTGWDVVIAIPVEVAVMDPGDPEAVRPDEAWDVTALSRPFDFRGLETMTTIRDAADPKHGLHLQAVWNLDFFLPSGRPDTALVCHEFGHALGFDDLYAATGFRDDLAYLGDWAIMANHWNKPHHSGYHKQQAGWIPVERILVIPPAEPDAPSTTEVLLVPVELWDGALVPAMRAAFGVPDSVPVIQLVQLDLGGDGAVYDLVEARQTGARFSQALPMSPAVLVTNAVQPWNDDRYAFNGAYRRELQLLNDGHILQSKGDTFDLAKARGLPAKGIVITVLDVQAVDEASIFRLSVRRENTSFVDLYFADADPFYENPDLFVDWVGDNPSQEPEDHDTYPIGSPTDQGEAVRVPASGTERHWVVARIRNRGQVEAEDVRLAFKMCVPPGGGDRSQNFQLIGAVTLNTVPGGDVPTYAVLPWDVPAGFGGHTCLAVEIADYKIPHDDDGAALATDDVWIANNRAQKNVTQFVPLQSSPYGAITFDYGVHNDGPRAERAYLEPQGLPCGMRLTVSPRRQTVPPKSTVVFRCRLELDDAVIDAGCRSDRQFRLVTWRQDRESAARWGGVKFKVLPRKGCAVTLDGFWGYDGKVALSGAVAPNPGAGTVRIRLAFTDIEVDWVLATLHPDGNFTWSGQPPAGAVDLVAMASFEGTPTYGPADSPLLARQPPPPIH